MSLAWVEIPRSQFVTISSGDGEASEFCARLPLTLSVPKELYEVGLVSASIYRKRDKTTLDAEANPLPTTPQDVLILLHIVENQMYCSKILPVVTTLR